MLYLYIQIRQKMYKGSHENRSRYDNPYFKESLEFSKIDFQTFISNIRHVLKAIGISYETLCRSIQAEGVHVNKDYPAKVASGKSMAPSLVYCSFFARKLNISLYRLLTPTTDFQPWFDSEVRSGKYSYSGPIVKFHGSKKKQLRISIKQGGLISLTGLQLNKEVIVSGGRIREVLNNGMVLNLGHFQGGVMEYRSQIIFLKNYPVTTSSFNSNPPTLPEPKKSIFNSNI